ncbi:MAG: hypothetical protein JXA71_16120 [Chitinispirillaceae bacterium]|nr:hypothetical protein [Chitinispirillaceae bacterium]
MIEPTVVFFDLSVALLMLVLAYLSKCLGDAMKTPPWFLGIYAAIFLVCTASGAEVAAGMLSFTLSPLVTLGMRLGAGIIALCVCIRYWRWLFSEFFGV